MSHLLIKVSDVSKAYRIWKDPASRLWSIGLNGLKFAFPPFQSQLAAAEAGLYKDFFALKGISFELRRGEAVGVIGRNGSGKSTLLQIIAGTLQPTNGTVEVNGRVAALLELGSGFNPEFTGRENVFMNAAILGITEDETRRRFAEIAAFADIGSFIEQPVKTYSSGMLVRLAFAVSVCIKPDILIVDEALSVGDVFFQQKCFRRIHELLDQGTSLLFVSHDTAAVQNLCDRVVLISQGEQLYCGAPEIAVSKYFSFGPSAAGLSLAARGPQLTSRSDILRKLAQDRGVSELAHYPQHGVGDVVVERVAILDKHDESVSSFSVGETAKIIAVLRAVRPCSDLSSGLHVFDRMNNLVFAAGTRQLRVQLGDLEAGQTCVVEFDLELAIHPGPYTLSVGCAQASSDGPNAGYIQHRIEGLGPIEVRAHEGTWPFYGIARLPLTICVHG